MGEIYSEAQEVMLANPNREDRHPFHPDYIVGHVSEIDFGVLEARGVKAVLIDLDGTVVSRGTFEVDPNITEHLKKQSVKIYIATNRPKSRDLKNLRESLHASGVIHPKGMHAKPFPKYYAQAATDHGLNPAEVAMIGDRLIQDIFGANRAGLTTILVRKLGSSHGFFDKQLSRLERSYTDKLSAKYLLATK